MNDTTPLWLKDIGYLLPHTYALAAIRAALLPSDAPLTTDLLMRTLFALVTPILGVRLFARAIHEAESEGGVGVVV